MEQLIAKKKALQEHLPHVIAISSGKGGVGKSSIAVNVALSLAKSGSKVCLFDADTGLANVNILLGIRPQYSLEHVLYGSKSIDEVMIDTSYGLKVIPGANGISECVELHPRQQLRLTRELVRIEKEFDYFLIDTAAGIASTTLDFISAAQTTLLVITPEPTSLTDAFSLVKLLKRRQGNHHFLVVVNMCANANEAREIFLRFSTAVEKYIGIEISFLSFIQRDESVRAAVSLQSPVALFPDSDPSSRAFTRLANSLQQSVDVVPTVKSFSSYWYRQFKKASTTSSENKVNPVNRPQTEVDVFKERDYLREMRSRMLLMISKGEVNQPLIEQLLRDSVNAYIQQFQQLPVNIVELVEQQLLLPDVDKTELYPLLVRLSDHLNVASDEHNTGVFDEPMALPEVLTPVKAVRLPILQSMLNKNEKNAVRIGFDCKKYGSQDQLLQRLTNSKQASQPLIDQWVNFEL